MTNAGRFNRRSTSSWERACARLESAHADFAEVWPCRHDSFTGWDATLGAIAEIREAREALAAINERDRAAACSST
jgi:hypothetical protein